jgi:hypothetical protein
MYIRLLDRCHSCTPTKSNLYIEISSDTVLSEPALYRLFTFHVPNLIFIFFRLGLLSSLIHLGSFIRIDYETG